MSGGSACPTPMPRTILTAALILASMAVARDRRLPSGEAANDAVSITATVYDVEQVKETVGAALDQDYIVLDVKLHPKTTPYDVKLDDFILRSENSGEHTGPLAAGQIAGSGMLVVKTDGAGNQRKGGFSVGMGGMMGGPGGGSGAGETRSAEMKEDTPGGSQLDVLKKKILAQSAITGDAGGLLFFPMNAKEKPKNLSLQCNTPAGTLRIKFK